jgi:hypothetical protein
VDLPRRTLDIGKICVGRNTLFWISIAWIQKRVLKFIKNIWYIDTYSMETMIKEAFVWPHGRN